jgi:xanthine dehydrogenase accessory factor
VNERAEVWAAAARLATLRKPGALATVCRRRGSLPMARDAKLVVSEEGVHWGTVGGGCTEADVIEQALAAAREGRPRVVQHTLNADLAGDLGLSCGGTADFFLEPVVGTPAAVELYTAVAEAVQRRTPGAVYTACDWDPAPRKGAVLGDVRLMLGEGAEAIVPGGSSAVEGLPRTEGDVFIEPLLRLPRVIVFGTGHVGAEIARLAARSGFYVVAVDDRAEFANGERLPGVDEVIARDFREVLDTLVLDGDDFVLATTRGHGFDAYIIERTAASAARYVGMLGSRRKKEVLWKALRDAGVPAEALDRVRVPVGEAIGADTPAEIAVSVVAELIRLRRLGDPAGEPL